MATSLSISPCAGTINYKIGQVDKRFNISQDEFLNDAEQAAGIWIYKGKTLFRYDSKAALTLNLVYDERQSLSNQVTNLQNAVESGQTSLEPKIKQYDSLVADFKVRLASLNQQVEYWNSQGGAPPDEYNKLITEQKSLQQEADQINTLAKQLDKATVSYNSQVDKLNQAVNSFNAAISQRPEEGLYDPQTDTIDIYFDVNNNELIHTLAHEFGHALGLSHISNKNAIMYPYSTRIIKASPEDTTALNNLCQNQTLLNLFQQRFSLIINNYR